MAWDSCHETCAAFMSMCMSWLCRQWRLHSMHGALQRRCPCACMEWASREACFLCFVIKCLGRARVMDLALMVYRSLLSAASCPLSYFGPWILASHCAVVFCLWLCSQTAQDLAHRTHSCKVASTSVLPVAGFHVRITQAVVACRTTGCCCIKALCLHTLRAVVPMQQLCHHSCKSCTNMHGHTYLPVGRVESVGWFVLLCM